LQGGVAGGWIVGVQHLGEGAEDVFTAGGADAVKQPPGG